MCGIAGYVTSAPADGRTELVRRMIQAIGHRGPDQTGAYADNYAALGHARLSIIDVEGGSQPIPNENRRLWIVFNGEIFNYVELAEDLVARGHVLATRSDTEVIVHLYEEYGADCVRHLNGDWAFAIWDSQRRELFLSRDRIGVRPLFYSEAGGTFYFGSEIKALFAHPAVRRELDIRAVDDVFTTWCIRPPRTAFRDVRELPPGHSMRVRNGEVAVFPHWQLHYPIAGDLTPVRTEAEYAEELFALLVDATRIRLRADVPVGAYLSGGLDSTITTALIQRFGGSRLRTFSVSFEDRDYDEQEFQQEAVDYLGTAHSSIRCGDADIGRAFPDVVWHGEAPLVRTAPAPLYLLSRLVRDSGFKVVLTGEGADEMFGGYDIFKEAKVRRFWLAQPQSKLRPLMLQKLYPYMPKLRAQPEAYLRAFFHVQPGAAPGPFFSHLPRWGMTAKNKFFFSDAVKAELNGRDVHAEVEQDLPAAFARWHPFCQAQYLEARYLLPGYILSSQGDRVAMAHAVEGRFPFLDYRVMEFAAKLPPHLKMKVLNEKYILKKAFGKEIPPSIVRRPKQPYRAPEARCFFSVPVRDYIQDLLAPDRIRRDNLFNPAAVQRLVDKVKANAAIGVKDNMALVGIVSTQILADRYLNIFRGEKNEYRAATASICE
jgi:asparagine synthase (glutamine-hydrolysing)